MTLAKALDLLELQLKQKTVPPDDDFYLALTRAIRILRFINRVITL